MKLPEKTIIGKKIPKQRFYENIELKPALKKKFTEIISSITFTHKFSQETLNLQKTKEVEEVLLFEIKLKDNADIAKIDPLLEIIDKSVPYPILFRFNLDSDTLFTIASKKRNESNINKSIIDFYLKRTIKKKELSEFEEEFKSVLNALNIKIVYENILKLFVHKKLVKTNQPIEETLTNEKKHQETMYEIKKLESLMLKEKQPDREYGYHKKIKELKKKLK